MVCKKKSGMKVRKNSILGIATRKPKVKKKSALGIIDKAFK